MTTHSSHSPRCSHEAIDFVINLKPAAHRPLSQMGHFPQIVSPCWPGALQLGRHPSQSWWRPSQPPPPDPFLSIQPCTSNATLPHPNTHTHTPPLLLTAGDNSSEGFNADLNIFPPPNPSDPWTSPQTGFRVHVRPSHAHGLRGTKVTQRHRQGVCADDGRGAGAAGIWRKQVHTWLFSFTPTPLPPTHIFLPMQKTATERFRRVEVIRLNGKMDGSFLGSHVDLLRDSIAFWFHFNITEDSSF